MNNLYADKTHGMQRVFLCGSNNSAYIKSSGLHCNALAKARAFLSVIFSIFIVPDSYLLMLTECMPERSASWASVKPLSNLNFLKPIISILPFLDVLIDFNLQI